jgi:hypothetical protein
MNNVLHVPSCALGQRRALLVGVFGALTTPLWAAPLKTPLVDVWKSPTCGCCGDWMRHLEANGFRTKLHDEGNAQKRAALGIAPQFGSCHTAIVDGYALEGHVPAIEIRRLLKERPTAIGLAVPGMPIGSPGMDGPEYAGRKDPYKVLLLQIGGGSSVYRAYA